MDEKKEKIKTKVMAALALPITAASDFSVILRKIKENRLYADPDITNLLRNKIDISGVQELLDDASVFTSLDRSFTNQINSIGEKFDCKSDELYHSMLAYEQYLRSAYGLPGYDYFNTTVKAEFIDESHYKNPLDSSASFEYSISYFSITLRSFLKTQENLQVEYSSTKFDAACLHFPLSSKWSIFHENRSIWEHGNAKGIHYANLSVFDSSQSTLLPAFRVSLSRLRGFRYGDFFKLMSHPYVNRSNRTLPIRGFRSDDEVRSAFMTAQQFYSQDLQEEVHGGKLCEWLRAYTIIKEIALRHIELHPLIGHPSTLLLNKQVGFFIREFIDAGIPEKSAHEILHHFTFNTYSKDILDTPLIPFNGELILIPTAAILIEPAFSLESLLKNIKSKKGEANHELQFIGPNFEQLARRVLRDAGITAEKVKYKNRDCDIAFVLENDVLFLCECKGRFQVSDFRSYVELEAELTQDAVKQHGKTCEYFENNLQHIRNRLHLLSTWKPSRVLKIILTSAKLGREKLSNDFYIIDENMFYAFFSRKKLHIRNLASRQRTFIPDARLDGPITVDAFIDYMDNPPNILRTRVLQEERELHLQLEGRTITFKDVECYGEALTEIKERSVWTPNPVLPW